MLTFVDVFLPGYKAVWRVPQQWSLNVSWFTVSSDSWFCVSWKRVAWEQQTYTHTRFHSRSLFPFQFSCSILLLLRWVRWQSVLSSCLIGLTQIVQFEDHSSYLPGQHFRLRLSRYVSYLSVAPLLLSFPVCHAQNSAASSRSAFFLCTPILPPSRTAMIQKKFCWKEKSFFYIAWKYSALRLT